MTTIIHPELSYTVQGIFMTIYNKHGPMLQEEIYEKLIVHLMNKVGLLGQSQEEFPLLYKDVHIETFRLDVALLPKLLIEIKVVPRLEPLHLAQAITYLKVTGADLAIVVNFGGPSLEFERVPNFISQKRPDLALPATPDQTDLLYPELTGEIRRGLYEVHRELGPGFWHRVYRNAAKVEFRMNNLPCDHILWLDIFHGGWLVGRQRCNVLVVNKKVMVTPIAVRAINEAMRGQFKAHLRRLDLKIGLLANFHGERLEIETIRAE
jgi:GxxExxY protein